MNDEGMNMEVARPLLSVMLVLTLLGGALWGLRRGPLLWESIGLLGKLGDGRGGWLRVGWTRAGAGPKGETPRIERIARLTLTPQHTLHLVRIQGLELVVATHPQGCSVVSPGGPVFEGRSGATA